MHIFAHEEEGGEREGDKEAEKEGWWRVIQHVNMFVSEDECVYDCIT